MYLKISRDSSLYWKKYIKTDKEGIKLIHAIPKLKESFKEV